MTDIEKIIEAAKAGGKILLKHFGQNLETVEKSSARDFCTVADLESEKTVVDILTSYFPTYNIISEELGENNKGSEFTFSIDPLDGTNNFVLNIPNFSVSIGLLKGDEVIAGVVYVPITNKTFFAEKGKGAFQDGNKLRVSKEKDILRSTLILNCSYETPRSYYLTLVNKLTETDTKRVLVNWSCAYDFCLLASGRAESIVSLDSGLHDFSAGKIIATEAGALLTDLNGIEEINNRNNKFVISNNKIINDIILSTIPKIKGNF